MAKCKDQICMTYTTAPTLLFVDSLTRYLLKDENSRLFFLAHMFIDIVVWDCLSVLLI